MKLLKLFLVVSLFFTTLSASAQDNVFKFANTGSESDPKWSDCDSLGNNYLIGIFNTSFEYQGAAVTGYTNAESGNNIFILKANTAGKPEWVRSIRGTSANESVGFVSATINNKGELAVVVSAYKINGFYIGDRFIPLSNNDNSEVLIKFTKSGFVNWTRVFNATGSKGGVYVKDIKLDDEGSVYLAGSFTGTSLFFDASEIPGLDAYSRMFVSKYYSNGDHAWASTCDIVSNIFDTVGGITATSLQLFPGGSLVIAGTYDGNREFSLAGQSLQNKGLVNAYIAGFESNGTALWAKPYEGDGDIRSNKIDGDENGNIVFTCFYNSTAMVANGQSYNSGGNYDLLVSKYTIAGISDWDRVLSVNIPLVFDDTFQALAGLDKNGNAIVAGEFYAGAIRRYFFYAYNGLTGNIAWWQVTSNSGSISFDQARFDNFGNTYFWGISYEDFSIADVAVTDAATNGVSFSGKLSNTGTAEYIYSKQNDAAGSNYLYFNWLNFDIFGNINILGNFNGENVSLESFLLSENFSSGIFISRFGPVGKLGGKIYNLHGNTITSGYVKLIGYSYFQKSPLIDSVLINNDGSYLFTDVPYGRYIIMVVPGDDGVSSYFPTYFPSAVHWEDAEKVEIKSSLSLTSLYIFIPEKPELSGLAKLTGFVTETDETDVFKSTQSKPSPKAKAKLVKTDGKSDYELIDETETDDNGDFFFENISDGSYSIIIEVAGLPIIEPYEVSVSGGMYVSNLDYIIEEEQIVCSGEPTVSGTVIIDKTGDVTVYPNPSKGLVNIDCKDAGAIQKISISNLQGKQVASYADLTGNLSVTISDAGIYFVEIITSRNREVVKLLINP